MSWKLEVEVEVACGFGTCLHAEVKGVPFLGPKKKSCSEEKGSMGMGISWMPMRTGNMSFWDLSWKSPRAVAFTHCNNR